MECWLIASRASTPCSSVSVCLCFPEVEAPLIWFGFGRVLVFEQASFGAKYPSQFRLPIIDVCLTLVQMCASCFPSGPRVFAVRRAVVFPLRLMRCTCGVRVAWFDCRVALETVQSRLAIPGAALRDSSQRRSSEILGGLSKLLSLPEVAEIFSDYGSGGLQ